MKYLTLRELSDASGVPAVTIRRYVKSGRIVSFQPGGRGGKLLFPPDALEVLANPLNPASPNAIACNDPSVVDSSNSTDLDQIAVASGPVRRPSRAHWRRDLPINLTPKEN